MTDRQANRRESAEPREIFDARVYREADSIVEQYPGARSALLPLLHLVQSEEGYVSETGIQFCAERLDLSDAEVSAVVSFYTMYKRTPCGQHLVSVCTNTLCAALGGDAIYAELGRHLGAADRPLQHEETCGEPGSAGSVTVEHAECLAACDFAPVLQVNYEYYDNQTVESARALVDALRRGEKPHPSRGDELTDWRTAERQIAGLLDESEEDFSDAQGEPATETVRGARMAEENGWTAPAMPDAELPPIAERK